MARDATTPMGLPLATWNEETFNNLANNLNNFGISRAWLNDLVSYDVVELVAGSIGILAVALNWNNDDVEEFSNIVGSIGLAAVVSANPFMLIVAVVALAKAFHSARKSGDWKEFSDGLAKGGVCTGAVLLTTSLMSGPMVVVLLSGICVGILANQATKKRQLRGNRPVHDSRDKKSTDCAGERRRLCQRCLADLYVSLRQALRNAIAARRRLRYPTAENSRGDYSLGRAFRLFRPGSSQSRRSAAWARWSYISIYIVLVGLQVSFQAGQVTVHVESDLLSPVVSYGQKNFLRRIHFG